MRTPRQEPTLPGSFLCLNIKRHMAEDGTEGLPRRPHSPAGGGACVSVRFTNQTRGSDAMPGPNLKTQRMRRPCCNGQPQTDPSGDFRGRCCLQLWSARTLTVTCKPLMHTPHSSSRVSQGPQASRAPSCLPHALGPHLRLHHEVVSGPLRETPRLSCSTHSTTRLHFIFPSPSDF